MDDRNSIFSLSLDTLRKLPDAVAVDDGIVLIDNTATPHVTQLTNAWKGTPVQLDTIMTIFCTEGEINVRIALREYTIRKNTVCVITTGAVVEVLAVSSSFHCITMAMSRDFINLDQSYTLQIMQLFKFIQRQAAFELTGMYAERYHQTFLEAMRTMRWEENPLRVRMMREYVYLLYCCLFPVIEKDQKAFEESSSMTHQRELYFRFMDSLQASYREHRSVAYYAEILGITPKHLSKIVYAESGQTALRWIEEYVIMEAKALLKQTDSNIQMVASRLNFQDSSNFGKFFRRITGMSPKEYREQ